MIITIDGPAATGKGTVAKRVAQAINFVYFDTGAMYRAFTWFSMQRSVLAGDIEGLTALLPDFHYDIRTEDSDKIYLVNGQDVSEAIRSRAVTALVSEVASHAPIREGMVAVQRRYAENSNAVFEGRDLGTVVFPKADLKIFLTATAEVRAERRYNELVEKGGHDANVDLATILAEINERDVRDSTREVSPLRQAEDAELVDTSDLSVDEVTEVILALIKRNEAQLP
jgi:cytidylate kinase